ncbi:MAG: hypothetical protein OEW39_07345 [Deltaproteobacteria bacterium]|nr:hypothetical protein [Deltaproteobacteria bacterium]
MIINDLKQNCPRCQGTGFQPGFSVLGVNQINYHGRCPVCQGRGFSLTELGNDLVALLKPIIREVLEEERMAAARRAPRPKAEGDREEEEKS